MKETMQDMKEEFHKVIEILKKHIEILEMQNSGSQIKTQLEVSPIDWIKLKTGLGDKIY
jgi:predicted naringenin-chalcone synthase